MVYIKHIICDDFKMKNPLFSMLQTKIIQRFNPYSAGIDFSRQNLMSTDIAGMDFIVFY